MPRRRGHDSSREIEAASRGAQLAQQGEEALLREHDITGQTANEGLQRAATTLLAVGERQEDREFQREEAMRDRAHRAELQAQETGSRERLAQAEMGESKRRYEEQTDIELAKAGLQRNQQAGQQDGAPSGAPLPGQMGPPSPEQQRQREQGEKGLEGVGDGQPRFIPTPEARAQQEAETGRARAQQLQAETRMAREMRLRDAAIDRHKEAQIKRDEVAMKAERDTLQAPIKADMKLLEKVVNGDLDAATMANLKESIGDHFSPELQAELESGTPGPLLARHIKTRMATKGIELAAMTGDLPDSDLMSTDHPLWQQFTQATAAVNQFFAASDVASFLKITSLPQKNRLVRKGAGIWMLQKQMTKMATAKARTQGGQPQRNARPAGPSAGAPPNQSYGGAGAIRNK